MKCRLCGETDLQPVLSLGNVPLPNALLADPNEKEERYPLDLVFCPVCALVQITETVDPKKLFSHYLYFSSVSKTMLEHSKEMVTSLIASERLGTDSLVVELASNDGYLLQYFDQASIKVLGVDPAENVARVANSRGIPTICDFFGEGMASQVPHADVVIANNVLGHVADLNGFVRGIRQILKPEGVAVIEVPYVRDMIDRLEFDTIYHEHLYYYSLTALVNLFKWNRLQVQRVERQDIHGGSLRIYVRHPKEHSDRELIKFLEIENALGVGRMEYYRRFGDQVRDLTNSIRTFLVRLKARDNKIVGYGAAAKGTMLLNHLGIGRNLLDHVVDATPAKQGLYLPGVHVPIVAPEQLGDPDYILVLAWNFANEIMGKHTEHAGKFILPIPSIRVL